MRKCKRILYVIPSLEVGGIESSLKDLCNSMPKDKFQVAVLVLSNNKLDLINCLDSEIQVFCLDNRYTSTGIKNIINLIARLPRIINIINDFRPDIVHTHIFQYLIIPIYLAISFSKYKIRHFHTIHTLGLHYSARTFLAKIKLFVEVFCYKLYHSEIICVSPEIKKCLLNRYPCLQKNHIIVICNAVNIEKFSIDKYQDKLRKQGFELTYVARLVEGKNHITLLDAFKILNKKYDDIYLSFVGDGDKRQFLEEYIDSHGISNVILYGNVNNVPEILSRASIGVFPSEYEGNSVAILEMMSMGLPIICSKISAFTCIFSPSEVFYFDVYDSVSLADIIESLYLDKNRVREFSAKSRSIAERYSLSELAKKYEIAYSK